jgi:hypothetical protein
MISFLPFQVLNANLLSHPTLGQTLREMIPAEIKVKIRLEIEKLREEDKFVYQAIKQTAYPNGIIFCLRGC